MNYAPSLISGLKINDCFFPLFIGSRFTKRRVLEGGEEEKIICVLVRLTYLSNIACVIPPVRFRDINHRRDGRFSGMSSFLRERLKRSAGERINLHGEMYYRRRGVENLFGSEDVPRSYGKLANVPSRRVRLRISGLCS
jgi:hypothetical protein